MIRFAVKDDLTAVRALWEQCFSDEGGFNDYFFSVLWQPDRTLLLSEDGALQAMTQMLPYRLCADGETGDVTYIYGACTAPQQRKRGLMRRLLEHSFALDRQAGRMASVLIPQEEWLFDFYRTFGYEKVFFVQKKRIQRAETPVNGSSVRQLTEQDIPALVQIYNDAVQGARVERDASFWRVQLALFAALGAGAWGIEQKGRLTAYAFLWGDSAQEAVGLDNEGEQALLCRLGLSALALSCPGTDVPLGVAKWYDGKTRASGYMNLMLN